MILTQRRRLGRPGLAPGDGQHRGAAAAEVVQPPLQRRRLQRHLCAGRKQHTSAAESDERAVLTCPDSQNCVTEAPLQVGLFLIDNGWCLRLDKPCQVAPMQPLPSRSSVVPHRWCGIPRRQPMWRT